MAGLIDVGILKPELANTFGAAQARQQAEQQNALRRQQLQVGELELKRLQEEREIMLNFQQQLKAVGKDPDLDKIFDALISTGNPNFVTKGIEGKRKLQEQRQYADYLRTTESAPSAAAPAPAEALPAAAPAPASANALAPSEPPVNAMTAPGAAAAAPTVSPKTQELMNRIRRVSQLGEAGKPELAILKMQLENQLRVEAAENATPSDLIMMKRLGYPQTQEGFRQYRDAQRTPPQPRNPIAVLQNGRPTLVDPADAIGKIPLTPAAIRIEGLGPGKEPPAPSVTQIQDPTDPTQMITINARDYKGGGLGSPGVIGLAGKTPAATAAAAKKEEGKQQASDILDTLETAYTELDRRKAVPSERRSAGSNILAYVAGTGAGQIAGRVVGTEAQTQRDIIQSSRNQLLNAVKNATGMSAQQLNSNVEFRSWLEALSDPTRSIEANRAILENMRKFIANNAKKAEAPASKPSPAPASGGWSVVR